MADDELEDFGDETPEDDEEEDFGDDEDEEEDEFE